MRLLGTAHGAFPLRLEHFQGGRHHVLLVGAGDGEGVALQREQEIVENRKSVLAVDDLAHGCELRGQGLA